MRHNKYWFERKRFGYGAMPTTWEGWLVVIAFILYILALNMILTKENAGAYLLYLGIGIVSITVITYKKTEGGLKWSWGKKKDETRITGIEEQSKKIK